MYKLQECLFGWYDLKNYKGYTTRQEAQEAMDKREANRKQRNRRAKRNAFNPNAFVQEEAYPVRIVKE